MALRFLFFVWNRFDGGTSYVTECPLKMVRFHLRSDILSSSLTLQQYPKLGLRRRQKMQTNFAQRQVPLFASTFVGREAEIRMLEALIHDPDAPLVTVTGTAGVGKTRLIIQAARTLADRWEDGVAFIPLSTVSDPRLVLSEIGKGLSLAGDLGPDAIRDRLQTWNGLILIDNFEQLIDAAVDIRAILPSNPDCTIIISSQRPLQIEGERLIRLEPLPVPAVNANQHDLLGSPSMQLMIERAHWQSIALDDASTIEAMAKLCRWLDGIPLAIELAATRLTTLSPELVLEQLQRGEQILSCHRRDAPERQRTMHAAINWSYELLPPTTQKLFLWLGPFAAGFDLDLVAEVTNHLQIEQEPVATITELMNLGLLRRVRGGTRPWYHMLRSIREFCLAELQANGDCPAAQAVVAHHVTDLARCSEFALTGPDSHSWSEQLERELPTIRNCVIWSLEHGQPEVAMVVASGLWRFMERKGRWQEVIAWVDQALTMRDQLSDEALIGGLLAKVTAHEDARNLTVALEAANEIASLLEGKHLPRLQTLFNLRMGALEHDQQHLNEAESYFRQASELAKTHGFLREAAMAQANLGLLSYQRADAANAETCLLSAKGMLEEIGDASGVASALSNLGAVMMLADDLDAARIYLDESLEITRLLGLKRDLIYSLMNSGALLCHLGEHEASEKLVSEAIDVAREINYPVLESIGLSMLAETALNREDYRRSAKLLAASMELAGPVDMPRQFPIYGVLIADLMVKTHRHALAAAILAKAESLAHDLDLVFEPHHMQRIESVTTAIGQRIDDPGADEARGLAWSTDEFVRQLLMAVRKVSTSPVGILVKVEQPDPLTDLTVREREILDLLKAGHSTQSMADHLSLSPRTVTTHIGNMMSKVGVSSRVELIAKAVQTRS